MSTVFNFVLIQDEWQLVYTAHNNHRTLLTNADVFHPWLGQKACEYRKDSYKNYIELTLVDGNWFQKYQFGKNQLCKPKNNWRLAITCTCKGIVSTWNSCWRKFVIIYHDVHVHQRNANLCRYKNSSNSLIIHEQVQLMRNRRKKLYKLGQLFP